MVASKRIHQVLAWSCLACWARAHVAVHPFCTLTSSILCVLVWQQQQPLSQAVCREEISSLCSPAPQIQESRVSKHRLSKELTSLHQEPKPPCAVTQRMGGSDRHSLLIPEPRATTWNRCLCEKGLTPAKPPASSFLPCFFRPQNNNSICAICTEACGFLLSLYTCYWTSPEWKSDSKALQDGRKKVNSEAMCTLLGWAHFSTPIKKEEKRGSELQTSLERHLNLINTTSTSFARTLRSTKLEK